MRLRTQQAFLKPRSLRVRERICVTLPLRSLRFQKCPFSAPGNSTQMKEPTWASGALTGRLASRHSATGQTNRRIVAEPIRRRTQRTFETMLTPRTVALTPQPPRFVRTGFKHPLGATGFKSEMKKRSANSALTSLAVHQILTQWQRRKSRNTIRSGPKPGMSAG